MAGTESGKGKVLVYGYGSSTWPPTVKQLLASGYHVQAAVSSFDIGLAKELNRNPNLTFVTESDCRHPDADLKAIFVNPGDSANITRRRSDLLTAFLNGLISSRNPAKVVEIINRSDREHSLYSAIQRTLVNYHCSVFASEITKSSPLPITNNTTTNQHVGLTPSSNHSPITADDFGRLAVAAMESDDTRHRRFQVFNTTSERASSVLHEPTQDTSTLFANLASI